MYRRFCHLIGCAFAVCFLCYAAAYATLLHPEDPNAALLGSFKVHLPLPLDPAQDSSATDEKVEAHVWYWQTAGGRVDYLLDIDSLRFDGNGFALDTATTAALFEAISHAAIYHGRAQGYSTCSAPQIVGLSRVYYASCMMRTGIGSATVFSSCGGESAYREYQYNCSSILPAVVLMRVANPYACENSIGCDSAYPSNITASTID